MCNTKAVLSLLAALPKLVAELLKFGYYCSENDVGVLLASQKGTTT